MTDQELIQEIIDNSYRDTSPREEILHFLSVGVVGLDWPCNGDTLEYKTNFYKKAGIEF